MKKLLALTLTILLALATVPIAAEEYYQGFIVYVHDDNSTCGVLWDADEATEADMLGEDGTLVIPAEINGLTVTGISVKSELVKHVIIPETVKQISRNAFMNCPNLESINLDPDRYMEIHAQSFPDFLDMDSKLKSFTADGQNRVSPLWRIGVGVFSGSAVETIVLDRSLKKQLNRTLGMSVTAEENIFHKCKALRTIFMTENVKELDEDRVSFGNFSGCTGLDYLCFPNSIEKLGAEFAWCTSLRTAVFPAKDLSLLFETRGFIVNVPYSTFEGCPKLTIFGKSGTTVEDYAKEANIPFIGSIINHGEPSTVVAQAAQTATVWLNGSEIPAYTVNGSVYVGESALKSFGFGMDWDNETRTTTVTKPESVQWAVELNTNPEPYSLDVYSSDVKFMMNGFPIPYLCVGYGESIVDVNALAEAVLY